VHPAHAGANRGKEARVWRRRRGGGRCAWAGGGAGVWNVEGALAPGVECAEDAWDGHAPDLKQRRGKRVKGALCA